MAITAVVNARTVQAAASMRGYEQGEAWYAAGCVSELEDADGGAVALVVPAVAGDTEEPGYEAWVGIEDEVLTAECPCRVDNSTASQLCGHAVAVALAGVDAGIRWAPAPSKAAQWTDPMEAFEALDAKEEAQVLHALLREQPELRERAWQLAVAVLDVARTPGQGSEEDGTPELRTGTAAAVEKALRALHADELRVPAGTDGADARAAERKAADALVEAVLEPFERDISRRLGLGLVSAAQAVALGVVDGLRACERGRGGEHQVLGRAPADLVGMYGRTSRDLLRNAGAALPEERD